MVERCGHSFFMNGSPHGLSTVLSDTTAVTNKRTKADQPQPQADHLKTTPKLPHSWS